MKDTTATNYTIYKKLLRQRVDETREQLAEATLKLKLKQAAYNAALVEEKAFEKGMDEIMNRCGE